MTYLALSAPFMATALFVAVVGGIRSLRRGRLAEYLLTTAVTAAALVILTAVFDNLMIAAGLFDYPASQISGITIVHMPIEDLQYPLASALLLSGVTTLSHRSKAHNYD